VDSYSPWSHDPTACRAILWSASTFCSMIPWSKKTMTVINPRFACPPGSPSCQFLLRQLLSHSYSLDSPSSKFQIVPSWTYDLHKPLCVAEFTSACRLLMSVLPNSHLCVGYQCLCCWIPRQPLFSSTYPPDKFSYLTLTSSVQSMFVNNLRCRFSFDEPIATVGMAASTHRHCFEQPTEVCTSCTFDIVTPTI
jgi:hypothetical protein